MHSLVVNALTSHGTEHNEWGSIYSPSISVTDINVQNTNHTPQPVSSPAASAGLAGGQYWGLLGAAAGAGCAGCSSAGFTKLFCSGELSLFGQPPMTVTPTAGPPAVIGDTRTDAPVPADPFLLFISLTSTAPA